MAGSRLDRLGTIFGRVTALIKCGAMKRSEKPVWYDVYRAFPPVTVPAFSNIREMPEIKNIFYPEDRIRAKFHQKMYRRLPAEDLMKEVTTDITRRAIDLTNKLMMEDEKLTLDEAVDLAIDTFRKEGLFFVRRSVRPPRTASQSSYQFVERTEESVLAENVDQSYKNISVQKIDIENLMKSNASKKKEES